MSWATRRRILYITCIVIFFAVVFGGPIAYHFLTIQPTCFDGVQNQGETAADKGGPCALVDEHTMSPSSVLWTRAFKVRDGVYNVVSYIENPNADIGAEQTRYRVRLYDADNILVAEHEGSTFILPGGITPVLDAGISTGNSKAVRAFFEWEQAPVWKHVESNAQSITISNQQMTSVSDAPRLSVRTQNTSQFLMHDISYVAVVFDTAGNAFAASGSQLQRLDSGESTNVVFTWPDAFPSVVGRIDVIPLITPIPRAPAR